MRNFAQYVHEVAQMLNAIRSGKPYVPVAEWIAQSVTPGPPAAEEEKDPTPKD